MCQRHIISDELAMSVTVAARLLLENPGAGGAGGEDVLVTAVPFLLCFSLL